MGTKRSASPAKSTRVGFTGLTFAALASASLLSEADPLPPEPSAAESLSAAEPAGGDLPGELPFLSALAASLGSSSAVFGASGDWPSRASTAAKIALRNGRSWLDMSRFTRVGPASIDAVKYSSPLSAN